MRGEVQSFLRSRETDSLSREEKTEETGGRKGGSEAKRGVEEVVAGPVGEALRLRCHKRRGQ